MHRRRKRNKRPAQCAVETNSEDAPEQKQKRGLFGVFKCCFHFNQKHHDNDREEIKTPPVMGDVDNQAPSEVSLEGKGCSTELFVDGSWILVPRRKSLTKMSSEKCGLRTITVIADASTTNDDHIPARDAQRSKVTSPSIMVDPLADTEEEYPPEYYKRQSADSSSDSDWEYMTASQSPPRDLTSSDNEEIDYLRADLSVFEDANPYEVLDEN